MNSALLRLFLKNFGGAFFEVAFVTFISLLPLGLARIEPFAHGDPNGWSKLNLHEIFVSGQLALYALSSLATIFLFCFTDGIPKSLKLTFGGAVLVTLIFISFVLGADPTLTHASSSFIGPLTGWIFVGAQLGLVAMYTMTVTKITDGPTIAAEDSASLSKKLEKKLQEEKRNG